MDNNSIIQSLWIGDTLSNMERLCINSYIRNGHRFHLYVYDEVSGVPPQVELRNAADIVSATLVRRDGFGSYAGFSDLFRYKLLYEKGGWWVDMDSVCVKPITIAEDYCFSSEEKEHRCTLNNGFIKCPAKADFLSDILNYIELSGVCVGNSRGIWGDFGPQLLQAVLKRYDSLGFIKTPMVFCPVGWHEIFKLITKQDLLFSADTLVVHMWNEVWSRAGLDKNAIYHPESLFERWKDTYLQDPL